MVSKLWCAVVAGHPFDIDDWADVFLPPFDPWMEKNGEHVLLRSASLVGDFDPIKADHIAKRLVTIANGVFSMRHNSSPIEYRGVANIDANGAIQIHCIATIASCVGRARVSAVGVVMGPDGQIITSPPQRSREQEIMYMAMTNAAIADVLTYRERRNSWFDFWKAYEIVRARSPRGKICSVFGQSAIKSFSDTCNYYRHSGYDCARNPSMTIDEAKILLDRIVNWWIDYIRGASS